MNNEERAKARMKLIEARNRCNWVIKNGMGGLTADLPYSAYDIGELKIAKKKIMLVHDKLSNPYPPPEPIVKKTRFPLFEYDYLFGYDPWDFHALNLPFHSHFDRNDWEEGVDLMREYDVNGSRFFLATGEKEGDLENYFLPYKRLANGKFDLTKFDENDMAELEWRLEKYWERDMVTMLCVATGIKGKRFKHTVWHNRNNINDTCVEHDDFMDHEGTIKTYKKVLKNLWERWKDKPVIFEFINEPQAFNNTQKRRWYEKMMNYCEELEIPANQFAFEKWDSGICEDLLYEFHCWMFCHAMNSMDHMERIHKGDMQREYFEPFEFVATNSDGGSSQFPGTGLVGLTWGQSLKKPAPADMWNGLKHDKLKYGAGWFIGSAGAYYRNPNGDKPHYEDWKKVAIDGLTKQECQSANVNWELFSYQKTLDSLKIPLGELVAIQMAAEHIFG